MKVGEIMNADAVKFKVEMVTDKIFMEAFTESFKGFDRKSFGVFTRR